MNGSSIRITVFLMSLIAVIIVFPGCGGGGGEGGSDGSSSSSMKEVIEWDPPEIAADGTPMDPKRDLDYYELYLRTDRNFSDEDLPVAHVASFTDVLSQNGQSFRRELTKEFDMENLLPFAEKGKRYYVSIRAVGVDGLKSAFMVPVAWDLT